MRCGCHIASETDDRGHRYPVIEFCALHQSAEKMRDALELAAAALAMSAPFFEKDGKKSLLWEPCMFVARALAQAGTDLDRLAKLSGREVVDAIMAERHG